MEPTPHDPGTPSTPSPPPVLDYGPPPRRRSIKLLTAYGIGVAALGAGAGLTVSGVLGATNSGRYNGMPDFAVAGGLGVCLLVWGLFTLVLVLYLRFGHRLLG